MFAYRVMFVFHCRLISIKHAPLSISCQDAISVYCVIVGECLPEYSVLPISA